MCVRVGSAATKQLDSGVLLASLHRELTKISIHGVLHLETFSWFERPWMIKKQFLTKLGQSGIYPLSYLALSRKKKVEEDK